ncbi:hypothetical protein vBVhaSMAG7_045 [Vibrio phage vB_VhaS_MAG7]|nr:hypothetical protein vBVhaSMAG7_045 [Vibrio phage vB_VhaS_MAG7]
MKTYNTYQEAKIANPEFEVAVVTRTDEHTSEMGKFISVLKNNPSLGGYSFADKKKTGYPNTTDGYYTVCYPSGYCMTVEKFLADGYKFVEGDVVFDFGDVVSVDTAFDAETYNQTDKKDDRRYILRAAALENQMNIDNLATQTPEEKEALDLIDTTPHQYEMSKLKSNPVIQLSIDEIDKFGGEAEWNGEGLPPVGCKVKTKRGVAEVISTCDFDGGVVTYAYGMGNSIECCWCIAEWVSPIETKQQREERERLEAAYDLYLIRCHAVNYPIVYEFHEFKSAPEAINGWLAVVDKTNYRKESN